MVDTQQINANDLYMPCSLQPFHRMKCQETLFRIDLSMGISKEAKETEEIVAMQPYDMNVRNVRSHLRSRARPSSGCRNPAHESPVHFYYSENSQFELIEINLQKN